MEQEQLDISTAKDLVSTEGWKWAKNRLEAELELYLAATLPWGVSDTALGKEMRRRRDVANQLRSWIQEIEDTAQTLPPDNTSNTTIKRF